MDAGLLLGNLLSPPILFFALGVVAVWAGSDLEVPQPVAKFISLYLLFAIGMHGGHALSEAGIGWTVAGSLGAAMLLAVVVPVVAFYLLRRRLDVHNAAALAATYGSVSAVTFVTAGAFLDSLRIPWGGHMVAALALMESPAIVVGVLLRRVSLARSGAAAEPLGRLLRESCFNGSVVLIVGSLLIGLATGARGWQAVGPFVDGIFEGMLSFFLLDMGLLAARRARDLRGLGAFLPSFAVGLPLVSATLALGLSAGLGLATGDAIMLLVLAASASYIAVPAAMRLAVPEANPSLYVSMALAVTFPFNILVGLPLYAWAVQTLLGSP